MKIIAILATFLVSMILGRELGSEGLGAINLSNKLISVFLIFSLLGINTSLLREISVSFELKDWKRVSNFYFSSLMIVIPIGIFVVLILFSISPFLSLNVFKESKILRPFYILLLAFIPQLISRINASCINGFRKVWQSNLVNETLSIIIVLLLLSLSMVFNIKIDLIKVAIFYAFGRFFVFISTSLYWGKLFKFYKKPKVVVGSILKMSFPLLIVSSTSLISNNADSIMLGFLSEVKEVGLYSVASSLAMSTSLFLILTASVLSPKIASLNSINKKDEIQTMVQSVSRFLFLIGGGSLLLFVIFGRFILSFWGEDFIVAFWPLIILSFGQFINICSGCTGVLLIMTGHEKIVGLLTSSFLLLNLILNLLLIPYFGAIGAAFATSISLILENLLKYIYTIKKTNINTIPSF
ncbi:oligosaccharide flippase family protein [Algoriphagus vanfongensis]|uniref:oligosaccharide flippase family protein n=1 Tax=Algoriphagus vanfongensis TaxID=426371 RepID=UPI001471E92E|nr:oligosaccharide flippase family protein [Algoriphagus vanfongensis]